MTIPINYIRTQNKALDKATKFAYIVLDEKKIAKTQFNYFESNNIRVINLNQMPLIEDIPNDLTNDIGKRLYSFLRAIENPSFENVFGTSILLEEAISFMKRYKYVDCKNLCLLLFIKQYHIDGYELFIHSDSEYDRLLELFDIGDADAQYLQQLFFDAGIYYVRLISSYTKRRDDYKITASHISLLEDKLYTSYLENDFVNLSVTTTINAKTSPFESCFYLSIVNDYTASIVEWHNSIKYDSLTTDDKVRYLFNDSVLESRKTYRNSNQRITKYINGFADTKEKRMYSLYSDLFEGNHRRLQELVTSFSKLKEQYYNSNNSFIVCSSLSELYKIRRVALEQYLFYFNNTLLFKGFSNLKKILKYYIEAIVCTNGNFIDTTIGAFGVQSVKERYAIDVLDFDIITKFITIKDLYNLIQDYSVDTFNVTEDLVNHAIICFDNLANSIMKLKIYNRFLDAPTILINCMILFSHFTMNTEQKIAIKDSLLNLFKDDDFINFFFSTDCSDFRQSTRVLCALLKIIPQYSDLDIVDKILHCRDFQSFYVNSDVRKLQSIISYFINNDELESIDEKLYQIIMSFEGRERIFTLRLLYRHSGTSKHINEYKSFLRDSFNLFDCDDIFDFTFDDWLDITEENSKEILSKAVSIYKQQQSCPVHSYPDPLQSQLELIYILFITEKISSIDCLHEIIDASDFLNFFLEPDNFDYRKVDFSNYMWENIARRERFINKIVEHKADILPNLQRRIETNQATEFERKILYGFLLDKSELL